MTQTGPAAQDDVLLPQGWSEANQATSLLFRLDGLELHLIPGAKFDAVADAVGTLRESTYRQQLSGSGSKRDLDGRDGAYESAEPSSCGSHGCNSSPSSWQRGLPGSQQSYRSMLPRHQGDAGGADPPRGDRSAARSSAQRQHSLMALFRVVDRRRSGLHLRTGLYNHFAYSDAVNTAFLSALMRPPYRRISPVSRRRVT